MAKKPKKPKKEKKPKGEAVEGEAPKKGGMVGKIALVVVMGVASFCTVFFLPRPEPVVAVAEVDAHATPAHEEEIEPVEIATGFIDMESFTVSLKDRKNILRLAVSLEIPEEMVEFTDPNNPELRDAFLGYLSAIDMTQVGDPAFLVRLRAQLTRRARFVLGDSNVQNVLITDFLVR